MGFVRMNYTPTPSARIRVRYCSIIDGGCGRLFIPYPKWIEKCGNCAPRGTYSFVDHEVGLNNV